MGVSCELQLSGLEHPPVVVTEYGEQDRASQPSLGRIPVDVEMERVRAVAAELEHRPPPRVLRGGGHVVGNDVEHDPEPSAVRHLDELVEGVRTAELVAQRFGSTMS